MSALRESALRKSEAQVVEDSATELLEVEESLSALCQRHGWDWAVHAATGAECAWYGKVRVTLAPFNPEGSDRSLVTYRGGMPDPAFAVLEAIADMFTWLAELGYETEPPK